MKTFLPLAALLCTAACANAQTPTINGPDMLCPNGTGTLTTETYDSYQWLRRDFGTTTTYEIAGETSQTLAIDAYNYTPSYISVKVIDNSIADTSAEMLIDSWAFLPPATMIEGDFGTGPNGEVLLCTGDTVTLQLMLPYVNSITWFDGGMVIPGENSQTLAVTGAGSYTVEGAPAECPDYLQLQGIPVDVIMDNCGLGLDEQSTTSAQVYPNPATGTLTVQANELIVELTIANCLGQIVATQAAMQEIQRLDVSTLRPGMYFLTISYGNSKETREFSVD